MHIGVFFGGGSLGKKNVKTGHNSGTQRIFFGRRQNRIEFLQKEETVDPPKKCFKNVYMFVQCLMLILKYVKRSVDVGVVLLLLLLSLS